MSVYNSSRKRKHEDDSATPAKKLCLERPLVVLDVATTGRSPEFDRIVEIVCVKINPNLQRDEPWRRRVRPGKPIQQGATWTHGLSNEDVDNSPTFAELAPEMVSLLRNCDISGYNINGFDLQILTKEFERAGIPFPLKGMHVVDSKRIFEKTVNHSIYSAFRFYCGGEMPAARSASIDATAAADILLAQLEKHEELPLNVPELHEYSRPKMRRGDDETKTHSHLTRPIHSYMEATRGSTTNMIFDAPVPSTPPNNRPETSPRTPPPIGPRISIRSNSPNNRSNSLHLSPSAIPLASPRLELAPDDPSPEHQQPATPPEHTTTSQLITPPRTVTTDLTQDSVDSKGWFVWKGEDTAVAFGKYKDSTLQDLMRCAEGRTYLQQICSEESNSPQDTKTIALTALCGKFPRRSEAPALPSFDEVLEEDGPPSPSPIGRQTQA